MRVIEGETLDCSGRYELPRLLEDVEFRRCTVDTCQQPGGQQGPGDRPVLRNVRLTRCHVRASDPPPLIADDCQIDTIWFHRGIWGPQAFVGCAFRHCVIRGAVTGSLIFTPGPDFGKFRPMRDATSDPYYLANRQFYESVDWALDISQASFTGVEFASGIPADLIRRDPARQVVLRRSNLLRKQWDERVRDPLARLWIEDFLVSGFEDTVVSVTSRRRQHSDDAAAIAQLLDLGLAEV